MFVDLKRGKGFSTGAKADCELFLFLLKTNTLGKIKVKNILNILILYLAHQSSSSFNKYKYAYKNFKN